MNYLISLLGRHAFEIGGGVAVLIIVLLLLCLVMGRRLAAARAENLRLNAELVHREELHRMETAHRAELEAQSESRFRTLAADILSRQSASLKIGNAEQMQAVLSPLREQLRLLGEAVHHTNRETAGAKAALGEQIRLLLERTAQMDAEAQQLTRALRGDSKKQGDWGEMIFARLLEKSGLVEGEHYSLQEDVIDRQGRHYRPDAVVRFPGNRCVVVDSKVSLTAYTRAVNCEDAEQREREMRAHVDSVRKHVRELAEKNYPSLVDGAVGYVLLFIPNEASYIEALRAEPELVNEAYRMGVIIVNPGNLLMALQLALNLWQNDCRVANVEKIVERASALYDKMVGVQESMETAKMRLKEAVSALDEADSRLIGGHGSLARQVEMLRELGVSPKKPTRTLSLPTEEK